MSDPVALRQALIDALNADSALRAAIPNGAYYDVAFPGSRRHVIVSLTAPSHLQQFGGRALHDNVYLVKAVVLANEPNAVDLIATAAARIDALLEGGTVPTPGFTLAALYLDPDLDIVDAVEVDEGDPAIRWYHRGGQYRLVASPDS